MIKVDELLNEFELKLNSLSRTDDQMIFLENKLVHLNNAQITWIKSKLNQNNVYRVGYEGIRKRIDDLQILKITNYKLQAARGKNNKYVDYLADISTITDYMFYVSSYAEVLTKSNCRDTVTVNLIKEGELDSLYYNENYSPSFFWRETLGTLGGDRLHVYSDGDFTVQQVYLTYLRYPKKIDKSGYVKLDGSNSADQDCELPEYAKNDIVDIAVGYAAQSTDNIAQAQFAEQRKNNNE